MSEGIEAAAGRWHPAWSQHRYAHAPTRTVSIRVPLSRVCPICGTDVARVPARREPHYGWLVIECPGPSLATEMTGSRNDGADRCGRVLYETRPRTHPTLRGWLTLLRGARAAITLGVLLFTGFIVFVAHGVASMVAAEDLAAVGLGYGGLQAFFSHQLGSPGQRLAEWRAAGSWMTAGFSVVTGIFAGAWVQTALGHLGAWRAWLIGCGMFVVLIAGFWGVMFIESLIPRVTWSMTSRVTFSRSDCLASLSFLHVSVLCMLLGEPGGSAVQWVFARFRRARWRRRLRRLRQRRIA